MSSVLFWLLQDLLTVLVWGVMQVPEIFLLTVAYRLLLDDRSSSCYRPCP